MRKFIWVWVLACFIPFQTNLLKADSQISPTTREMNFICWQEFQELVPEKINTVLLPVGSLEPHGVIPNGTDNLAPEAMAKEIANKVNALIAPTLNYGVTPAMKAYPGAVSIKAESYTPFVEDILESLAAQGFLNIIILNGHGGNTQFLKGIAEKTSNRYHVRILTVNWWSLCDDITQEVFGEDGGHAGNNETAYVQAIYPQHIHPQRYSKDMASANPTQDSYYAVPIASSIGLYREGEGYPTFNMEQAKKYFDKVNDRVAGLIEEIIIKWDSAGIF